MSNRSNKVAAGRAKSAATKFLGNPSTLTFEIVPAVGSKGALVRNRVAMAAIELFGAYGYEGASTRDIAKRAGIRLPLLLYHFKSKHDLWISVIQGVTADYRFRLEKSFEKTGDDPTEMLRVFIEHRVRFLADVPQLHRIWVMEGTQGSDRLKGLFDSDLRDHHKMIIKLIRRCQAAGTVLKVDPARLYFAILAISGQFFSIGPEFKMLTGKDVFSASEIRKTVELISKMVFTQET